MRTALTTVFTIFTFFVLSGQILFDKGSRHIVNDAISVGDAAVLYNIYGTCNGGRIESQDSELYFGYPYVKHGGLSYLDGQWVALTAYRESDDIYPNILELAYIDASGNTRRRELERDATYKDFVYYQKDSIAILKDDIGLVEVYDMAGGKKAHTFSMGVPVNHLETFEGDLYGMDDASIYRWGATGVDKGHIKLDSDILAYDFSEAHIYVVLEGQVLVLDEALEVQKKINLGYDGVKDIYGIDGQLHILYGDEDGAVIRAMSDEGEELSVSTLVSGNVAYSNFIKGATNKYIYGQNMPNPEKHAYITHGVVWEIKKENPFTVDVAINMQDVREVIDTFNTLELPHGTVYEVTYTYPMTFSVTNQSGVQIDDVYIVSNLKGGINCHHAQMVERYSGLGLMPGETRELEYSLKHLRKFDEICLHVVSVNGEIDYNTEDNITCKILVSSNDVSYIPGTKVYPNPAKNFLHIESEKEIASIHIYNSLGQLVSASGPSGVRDIDVSHLKRGVYHIEVHYAAKNQVGTARFVKE